ncbi:hypothetical protein LD13_gp137 [Bacillus phage Bobb]|uniref:Uncharacterized protein n=1 Tax=Bacillus phage Bobb TaxID=1527469 RepID=A0A076G8W5_9CAUD|nr:hypothetical protein LD13_gp137 [Bacillus phage Bobb]AII28038.1 hypothetical protein [Bacillus phage Bobb]
MSEARQPHNKVDIAVETGLIIYKSKKLS